MSAVVEFQAWPKTVRLFRDMVVTEKIDGTNAAVRFISISPVEAEVTDGPVVYRDGQHYLAVAQSRNRIITPDSDNYGFARWVHRNASQLVEVLGEGTHFGEWWGKGIQRNYGMETKAFSLFDTRMHYALHASVEGVPVTHVPIMYQGSFSEDLIRTSLGVLKNSGSAARVGFMNPEGICVYHSPSKSTFKVTLDNNDSAKWEQT